MVFLGMLEKNLKKIYCSAVSALLLLINAGRAKADSGIWKNLDDCRESGSCSLNDFTQLAVNIFNFVLGIVGSLALIVFIYGGILLLFSGGNSDQIEKGKNSLKGAVIGLVVIFCSYLIVYFTAKALGLENAGDIFNSEPL